MATTMRFLILGDDRASSAFNKFARSVDSANKSVDRHNTALARQGKAADSAQASILGLTGTLTGLSSASDTVSRKTSIFAKTLAAINVATGIGEAGISALAITAGGLATGLTAAGIGLGAYGVALKPVMSQISDLQKLQKQAASGNKQAAKELQQLTGKLKYTAPAVLAFNRQLTGVRDAYKRWGLAMSAPVLAPLQKALALVEPLLFDLSPFVREAAKAVGILIDKLGRGIKSTGFHEWLATMLPLVKPTIVGLGTAIGNLAVGLGGVLKAFAPFARGVIDGIVKITARFRDWGTTLTGHSGFKALVSQWKENWPLVRQGLTSLLTILTNVLKSMAAMATPSNSRALWQIANPLLTLAVKLSSNPALVQALLYLTIIGKGASQIKGVWGAMTTAFGGMSKAISLITGGKINLGMQSAGDTMLIASKNMQRAADTMIGAGGKGAAGGAAAGGAGGILSRLGLTGKGAAAAYAAGGAAIAAGVLLKFREDLKKGITAIGPDVVRWLSGIGGQLGVAASGWANLFLDKFGGKVRGWFTSGIGAVAGAIYNWTGKIGNTINKGVNTAVSGAGHWLLKTGGDLISGLWSGAKNFWTKTAAPWWGHLNHYVFTTVGNLAGILVPGGADTIKGLLGGARNFWSKTAVPWLKGIPHAISSAVGSLVNTLFGHGKESSGGLLNGAKNFWTKSVSPWMKAAGNRITTTVGNLARTLVSHGKESVTGLLNGAKDFWNSTAVRWIRGMGSRVASTVGNLARTLLAHGRESVSGLLNGVKDFWNSTAVRWVRGIGGRIAGAVGNLGRTLWNHGRAVVSGMLQGIRSFMAGIGNWVKGNIVNPLVNAVKNFFGIHSPSTVMFGIGQHLVGGLLRGLATSNGADIARTIFGSLPNALGRIVQKGLVAIRSLPGKVMKLLGGLGSWFTSLFGGGGGGVPGGPAPKGPLQDYARKLLGQYGWGNQFPSFNALVMGESGWNVHATNPSSGAYGIPQALPASKMASAGADWRTSGYTQLRWMMAYIKSTYGSPARAYAMWSARSPHWYGEGGVISEPILGVGRSGRAYVFGERGPETVTPGRSGSTRGPLISIEHYHASDAADASLLAQRVSFALLATGGLGS